MHASVQIKVDFKQHQIIRLHLKTLRDLKYGPFSSAYVFKVLKGSYFPSILGQSGQFAIHARIVHVSRTFCIIQVIEKQ